ncbi:hypothetical protein D9613_001432 [Agrocybe pediades]|uniref:F-box domain-containing protein n=1 Tax=Agrocybe pediades TaxID=84607 RepID=A0A8H4VV86_9AGAR|nr:hypothetical protein D9613_001432 [Agrocybe pediades]
MAPNNHSNRVKEVPDNVPSVHISSLCPNGDRGCFACREIGSLEREADEISKKLADVLARLTNAKSAANHAHSTILAKLPNEILSYIFCAAWDAMDPSPPTRSLGYEEPQEDKKMSVALLLAGVCRKWRAIALSLPRIWSDIHVFIHRQKGDNALSIFRDIVKRSNRAGLTIRLYSERVDGIDWFKGLQPALSILQKESERWRSLQMCVPYILVKALLQPNMDLSRVYSLYVHSNEHDYMGLFDPLWEDKHLRPQCLSLDSPVMKKIDIAWDRVARVVAYQFTADQAMTVIRSAPLLTTLELMQPEEGSVTELYSKDFVHQHLQHLIYYASDWCSEESDTNLFSLNFFPALKTVDYHTMFKTDDDSFLEHLIQKKPPIQELKLHGSPYDSSYVIRALRAVGSTLKRLDFEPEEDYQDEFEYDNIFKQLTADNPSPPPSSDPSDLDNDKQMFLPRLEYLRFTSGWPFAWDRVPAFFGSPSDPYRRPLKTFIFRTWGNEIIPETYLIAVINLRKVGFVVESEGYTNVIQNSLEFHGLSTST